MSLTIVRHGESIWNHLNLFTGFQDVDLTDNGVNEAINCGLSLKKNKSEANCY